MTVDTPKSTERRRRQPVGTVVALAASIAHSIGAAGTAPEQRPRPFGHHYLLQQSGGISPKDWGMSPQCARMVRKNRLRRLGIGADHC